MPLNSILDWTLFHNLKNIKFLSLKNPLVSNIWIGNVSSSIFELIKCYIYEFKKCHCPIKKCSLFQQNKIETLQWRRRREIYWRYILLDFAADRKADKFIKCHKNNDDKFRNNELMTFENVREI